MSTLTKSILILILVLSASLTTSCNPISHLMSTPTPTYTPTPTKTPTPVATDIPTVTPATVSEATPTDTPTLTPVSKTIPTDTPKPSATPVPLPTDTPTETPVLPTPVSEATPIDAPATDLDFRIASWRLWPLAMNSGCAKGMHTIFITVLGADGQPINDIIVGDSWGNVQTVTGTKGTGKAEIDLWSNTMEMVVKGNTQGATYTSEVSFPFSSFMTTIPNEQMIQAGYCSNELECDWKRANDSYYCGAHYSWEVIFQATRPLAK